MGFELGVAVRRQHELIEELRIEEAGIRLAGSRSISSLVGIARNRDLFPDFETHLKVFGDLIQITPQLIRRRWPVERRVVAHRSEQGLILVLILAILAETFSGKRALRVLSLIDLALPAFVGPGGGPKANEW